MFLGAFAVAGIADLVKKAVQATVSSQATFAALNETVKNAGAANSLYGQSIDSLINKEAALKGFSSTDLAQSFQQLVSVTKNSAEAYKLLGDAQDLARSRGTSLQTSALAVARAYEGTATSLSRYGIIVPKVTTAEASVKLSHDALVASGAKLTESYKQQYDASLTAAKAQDKTATGLAAIAAIEQRFGGLAGTYAHTAAGEWDRLKVDVSAFAVSIGTPLLGGLARVAEGLGSFITDLTKSGSVGREAANAEHDLADAFDVAKAAVETVGPPLLAVVDHLGGVVRVTELLGGLFVANKIGAWLAGIGAGEATVATGTTAAAAATTELTAALVANTAALTGNAAAAGAATTIYDAYGVALATVATGEVAVGDAAVVSGAKVGIFAGAVGLASKALLGYLAVYEAIKNLIPGQGNLGYDFSNSVAKDVVGANASPYAKGTELNDLYQKAFSEAGTPAGKRLLDQTLAESFHGQTLPAVEAGLKAGMVNAVSNAAHATAQDAKTGKTAQELNLLGTTIGQALATQTADALQAAQLTLTTEQDKLAAAYDAASAPIDAKIAAVQRQQAQITALTNRQSLRQLEESIALPGDKALSTNTAEARRQLDALQAASIRRTGHADPALAAFILQFRTAALTVTSDRLNLEKGALDAAHTAATVRLQIAGDILKVRQDVASSVTLQTKIANDGNSLQVLQKQIANVQSQERAKQLAESQKQTEHLKKIQANTESSPFGSRFGLVGPPGLSTSLGKNPGTANKHQALLTGTR